MSPSAEPATPAAPPIALPERLLEGGEVVILAVKPSRWFVWLMSWPVLVLAVVVLVVSFVAERFFAAAVDQRTVLLLCSAVGVARVVLAGFQWLGRLYVLTDRRVLRLRGVLREDVYQCPLKRIRRTHLSLTLPERLVGVGSLLFELDDSRCAPGHWLDLAEPQEVQRLVEEALRRAR
jgi:hypothetical protein